ncbi:alpha/beta fold hydrolase [Ferroacidibacillus organovorans]|uniref:Peptidase S9 prolyl oligopeptidase catalytic domain-containing protein n=1 Tax=Ferroacidibacillus organovorans TaxID=1765683 RepID=A0A853K7G6_9BACL|nr:alpha/beta fold hydrolase [Ferroacidibacillus organovorans]KYP79821.1 hypothetical protein AYJ22_13475 [Ferroacidibacillus organovorans]OAG92862.1 hypothetical protein AYW79_13050 [Ferroacidibacillus organovorans]
MHSMVAYENAIVDGIPVSQFALRERTSESLPTIFLYHGWDSAKDNYVFEAEVLSLFGFRVIVTDAPLHGDRSVERNVQSDFWKVIIQSVEEFKSLLDYAHLTWGVNAKTSALVGSSMGGFTVAGIFANYPDVHCVVSINGSGAWEESEALFRRMDGRSPATDEELHLIRLFDPIRKIARLPRRPILLQHGASDSIVPIDGQRKFYKELLKNYVGNHTTLVEFQEVPRMNHYISIGMFEYVYKWVSEQLKR